MCGHGCSSQKSSKKMFFLQFIRKLLVRIRYSYSEWVKLANNSLLQDVSFPRNDPCPYDTHDQCSVWFTGKDCEGLSCFRDFHSKQNTRLTFNSLNFALLKKSDLSMADVLFYDEGAWDIYDFRGIITRTYTPFLITNFL